jgi:hypothetical protein
MAVLDHCETWRVELLLQAARTQDNESRVGTVRNDGRWVHNRRTSQGLVKCANPVAPIVASAMAVKAAAAEQQNEHDNNQDQ